MTFGCATNALWNKTALDAWNEPADTANLRLYRASKQKDVLVVYDEYSERSDRTYTRAYWLGKNQKQVQERLRPHFVSVEVARGLSPVPIFPAQNSIARNSAPVFYAIASMNGQLFTIYSNNQTANSHELPAYNDGKGLAARIVLTPVTVVADITIVGGYLWASSGFAGLY